MWNEASCQYLISRTEDRIATYLYKITLIQLLKTQSKAKQNKTRRPCGRISRLTSAGTYSALSEGFYKVGEVVTTFGRSKEVS